MIVVSWKGLLLFQHVMTLLMLVFELIRFTPIDDKIKNGKKQNEENSLLCIFSVSEINANRSVR
jgi:hypothetical protein